MLYYVDGSKSHVGCQIAITDIEGNLIRQEFIEEALTSNEAEYEAIFTAASIASDNSIILSDSKLCVDQIEGRYKINFEKFQIYVDKIKKLIKDKNLKLKWISREANLAGHLLEKTVKENARKRNKKTDTPHKGDS